MPASCKDMELERTPHVIAVGGGKGGVGKSFVSVNLAAAFAAAGKSVCLVDGDAGGSDLHVLLGVREPELGLLDLLEKTEASIHGLIMGAAPGQPYLIAAGRDPAEFNSLKHVQRMKLLRRLRALPADVVVIDLGAGSSLHTLDMFGAASSRVLVTTPDPTAIQSAHQFARAAFVRKCWLHETSTRARRLLNTAAQTRGPNGCPGIGEVLARIEKNDPAISSRYETGLAGFGMAVVVNMVRRAGEPEYAAAIARLLSLAHGLPAVAGPFFPFSELVLEGVRNRRPCSLDPEIAASMHHLAAQLDAGANTAAVRSWANRDYYDLLGLPRDCAAEDIAPARAELDSLLAAGSAASEGLCSSAERSSIRIVLNQAAATLQDPRRREHYDGWLANEWKADGRHHYQEWCEATVSLPLESREALIQPAPAPATEEDEDISLDVEIVEEMDLGFQLVEAEADSSGAAGGAIPAVNARAGSLTAAPAREAASAPSSLPAKPAATARDSGPGLRPISQTAVFPTTVVPAHPIAGQRVRSRPSMPPLSIPSGLKPAEELGFPSDTIWTGPQLARLREARGISVQDLEVRTRIKADHIRGIESGSIEALPAATYCRGYLRSIARELGLDSEKLVAQWEPQLREKEQSQQSQQAVVTSHAGGSFRNGSGDEGTKIFTRRNSTLNIFAMGKD
ncbi:MAG: Iron-sulfur cluster carrier protein [Myxococcota bacterium]|nr:Iron-sulfur cluster carrier protein [Myxococcota bacterium]